MMNRKTFTLLALIMLIAGLHTSPAYAYFRTIEGVNNIQTRNVIPSRYYDIDVPHFRSQRGRNTQASPSPTTGNYDYNRRASTAVATTKMAHGSIRSLFGHVGLSQYNAFPSYDNKRYTDSKIKFRELTSHTCFEPVGSEIDRCKKRFSEYYNLKESILDGSIYTILVKDNPKISQNIEVLYQKMVTELQATNVPVVVKPAKQNSILLRDRMLMVWDACKLQTADHRSAARCYIRNDRQYLSNELLR